MGHDAIIVAFNPKDKTQPDIFDQQVAGHKAIITAVRDCGVKRLLAVGGAGSLKLESGEEYLDSDLYPPQYEMFRSSIRGTRELYVLLQNEDTFDWVFLAPSLNMEAGERTGKFRIGTDYLLFDDSGESRISVEDFAVAMLDETENPQHHQQRFTVGY